MMTEFFPEISFQKLQNIVPELLVGRKEIVVPSSDFIIVFHSSKLSLARRFKRPILYFCRSGARFDAHQDSYELLKEGIYIVANRDFLTNFMDEEKISEYSNLIFFSNDVEVSLNNILYESCRLGEKNFQFIAVTGTNGKTSTVQIVRQLLERLDGKEVLNIGTIGACIGETILPNSHVTMPDFPALCEILSAYEKKSSSPYVVLEATSHGLQQQRLGRLKINIGAFLNISHDHLDYHGTFQKYMAAKAILFRETLEKGASVVINRAKSEDEFFWKTALDNKKISKHLSLLDIFSFNHRDLFFSDCRLQQNIDYFFWKKTKATFFGIQGEVVFLEKNKENFKENDLKNAIESPVVQVENFIRKYFTMKTWNISAPLLGNFQLENLLTAMAICVSVGYSVDQLIPHLQKLKGAPGRLEIVSQKPTVVIDYAHTPDALDKILLTCRSFCEPHQRVILVIGCGGDRDRLKRSQIGRIAAQYADVSYFTSDNPRSEDPEQIISDMLCDVLQPGSHVIHTIVDRQEAIESALSMSLNEDFIIIAGKGHEKFQEVMGSKIPFDDKKVVQEYFQRKS